VLEEAKLVGRSFNSKAHNQSTNSEIVKFGKNGRSPSKRKESVTQLPASYKRLYSHGSLFGVNLQNIYEVGQINLFHGLLVFSYE
jgi:hypothetical protein